MTTEPAGVGTADEIDTAAFRFAKTWFHSGVLSVADLTARVTDLIRAERTASRRQAKEEDAKIAETHRGINYTRDNMVGWRLPTGHDIAEAIRSSINPPGEEE